MKTAKYFTTTWSAPCKVFKPIMNEISEEGYKIDVIDIELQQDSATQYSISSVPTIVIEENGVEVDRFVGALPKQQVIEKLSD